MKESSKTTKGMRDSYKGEYNARHGRGVLRYINGDVYEGEFKGNKRNGRGIMRFASGGLYKGEFQDEYPLYAVKKPR